MYTPTLTRSSLPRSEALMWRVDMTIYLFLLTFIIVARGAALSHPRRLGEELDLNEPGSRNSIYNSIIQRRWFLSSALMSLSSSTSSSPNSDEDSNLRSLLGVLSLHQNASVQQSSSAIDGSWSVGLASASYARDRLQAGAAKRLPRAIIVGVKKCGTRALLEYLKLHPDVRAAGHEVHFFDRHYDRGLDWYRSQMPATLPGQLTIEKTPSYFVTSGVAQRIYNMSRDIRLLVVVRDPVTRALSDYAQSASKRPDLASFESLAFAKGRNLSVVDATWGPIRLGLYARYVAPWQDHFTPDRLLFVCGERLVTDPASEMASVQSFLGLRPFINSQNFYFNATKGFPCLRSPSGTSRCLGKSKGRRHPSVDMPALQRLRHFYRHHNALFYQMTGIDFGWQ